MNRRPYLIILAGPNGCGKSTLADILLRETELGVYVNADVISKGLSSSDYHNSDIEAGRIMLERLQNAIKSKESLAYETTMSGKSWVKLIKQAKQEGYYITICYVFVSDVSIAIERVKERVSKGGHNIPTDVIIRRFERSKQLFSNLYKDLVDNWYVFDNSKIKAEIMAKKENGITTILDALKFNKYFGTCHE